MENKERSCKLACYAVLFNSVQNVTGDLNDSLYSFQISEAKQLRQPISLNNQHVTVMGRVDWQSNTAVFGYPGVTFSFITDAEQAYIVAKSTTGKGRLDVYLNGKLAKQWVISAKQKEYAVLGKSKSRPISIRIVNRGETWHGVLSVAGLRLHNGELLKPKWLSQRKLLIVGDSVSCGALMNRNAAGAKGPQLSNAAQSYGMLLAAKLTSQIHLVCYGGRGLIRSWDGNPDDQQAPEYFEYTIPSGENAPLWDHQSYIPDGILVSLGTNDFSLGIPNKIDFISAYVDFVARIQALYPKSHIFITEGPMLNDNDPTIARKTIAQSYLKLIETQINHNHVNYLKSFHYPGDECDPHPTTSQHRQMAEDFVQPIRNKLGW